MDEKEEYVSRAGYKLAKALDTLRIDFTNKIVVDIGASTGGFTEVALKAGATKVYAVEKGTDQLHKSLRANSKIISMEQTDIRDVRLESRVSSQSISLQPLNSKLLLEVPDVILVDVSFVSLRSILPYVATLMGPGTELIAMLKPQFEAKQFYPEALNRGVIKNKTWRRNILKEFEVWVSDKYYIQTKVDSSLPGAKGNLEKFYLLRPRSRG